VYVVILAGGGGTRLRPLSRDDRPKPFLPLVDDRTLIRHTVDRLPRGVSGIFVVANGRYRDLVRTQVPEATIVEEPEGRNTAAAIALATLAIDRPEDEVMVVLPADHVIDPGREGLFAEVLTSAEQELARGVFGIPFPLVTLGTEITRPATEYGYLHPDPSVGHGGTWGTSHRLDAYRLRAFEEKPHEARARELQGTAGVAWNAGIFLWRRQAIRLALARDTHLLSALAPAVRSGDAGAVAHVYAGLRTRSIDYEVMEPAARRGDVVMGAMNVGWGDIGGWTALLEAIGARGTGRVLAPAEEASVGPDDLAIVAAERGLAIQTGPSTIRSQIPVALLTGAAQDRDRVEELLARVAAAEAQQP
jgi:mannose-1-phosphate guanylyltransferase